MNWTRTARGRTEDTGSGGESTSRLGSLASRPADTLLTQTEVAERWRISARSLERWRCAGVGPRFVKLGNAVRYRVGDVIRYELAHLRALGADQAPDRDAPK